MTDFLALHRGPGPLLLPNAWDIGSARLLASLGFKAIATTSSGHAATLGRLDGSVTREEALAHARTIAGAVELPVSADLENCFDDVTATIEGAVEAGLAGCSIEDYSGEQIYSFEEAVSRVETAVEAASGRLVLTARAENHIRGRDDLDDTIARLKAYEAAGADVVYAPGPTDAGQIARIVGAVSVPVNVLARRENQGSPVSRSAAGSRSPHTERLWKRRRSSATRGRTATPS